MTVIIEDHIPVPEKIDSWVTRLNKLEVGQSFSFPLGNRNTIAKNVSFDFHRLTNKRFTISTKNQGEGVGRVWRINDAK